MASSNITRSHQSGEDDSSGQSTTVHRALQAVDEAMLTTEGRAEELVAFHTDRLSWRVYRTLCQLRFGYLSFLVVMGILMFSFTLLMENFFAIFLPSVRTFSTEFIVRSLVFLILLPVLLFVLSYVFEEALRLFIDGINHHDGGLPNFRLALAVVIHYVRHRNTFKQQEDDNQPGDNKTTESTSTSLFISEKDDPFADPPEENDADHEEPEVDPGHDDDESSAVDNESPSPARRRWKRAAGAVIATNMLKKPLFDGPPVGLSTYLMVDIVCPVVFELMTITAFVIELIDSWSIYSAFLNYVRAGFWLMVGYLVVWIVCHFWSSRNAHMRLMVSHYRRKRRSLQREVRKIELDKRSDHLWLLDLGFRFSHHVAYHIKSKVSSTCCPRQRRGAPAQPDIEATTPFHSMEGNHVSLAIDDQSSHTHGTVRAKLRAKNPWHRLSHGKQASILLLGCVIAAIVSFWYFGVGWPLLGWCLILLSHVIQRRFPQVFGKAFRHFIVTFVVLSLVFFSSTWIVGTFVSGGDFHLGAPTSDTLATANSTSAMTTSTTSVSQTIEYPVYDRLQWAHDTRSGVDHGCCVRIDARTPSLGHQQPFQRHSVEHDDDRQSQHSK